MIALHHIARRVADRIGRTLGALADDFKAEAILIAEADSAGLTDPAAVAQVDTIAAEFVAAALPPAGVPRGRREAAHV